MNNQIIKLENNDYLLTTFEQVKDVAKTFFQAGVFQDIKSEAQAVVKILAGRELGVGPFASMNNIDIIKGKAVINAKLLAARLKSSGKYNYKVLQSNDQICEIQFYENHSPVGTASFTYEEATKAGLTTKDNWKYYKSDMLFARALSRGARRFCPDLILAGSYIEGELDDNFNNEINNNNVNEITEALNAKTIVQEAMNSSKKTTNTINPNRPYTVEQLINKFKSKIEQQDNNAPISEDANYKLNMALNSITTTNEEKSSILNALTNKSSVNQLNQSEAIILLNWLGYPNDYEPSWQPTDIVKTEAEGLINSVTLTTPKNKESLWQNPDDDYDYSRT